MIRCWRKVHSLWADGFSLSLFLWKKMLEGFCCFYLSQSQVKKFCDNYKATPSELYLDSSCFYEQTFSNVFARYPYYSLSLFVWEKYLDSHLNLSKYCFLTLQIPCVAKLFAPISDSSSGHGPGWPGNQLHGRPLHLPLGARERVDSSGGALLSLLPWPQ